MSAAAFFPGVSSGVSAAVSDNLPTDLTDISSDALRTLVSSLDIAGLFSQRARLLQLHTALPRAALLPQTLAVTEGINQLFHIEVECVSTSAHLELKALIGEQVTASLMRADGSMRRWHGYVSSAHSLGAHGGLARYRLVLQPWLGLLANRSDTFVYQGQPGQTITVREIVEDLFKDHPQANWRWDADQPLLAREICTQYRETDLAFVLRLLSEEGLSYRFEHDDALDDSGESAESPDAADATGTLARHCLVISDALGLPAQQPDLGAIRFALPEVASRGLLAADTLTAFGHRRQVTPNALTLGAWAPERVAGVAASVRDDGLDARSPAVPDLEVYQGQRTERLDSSAAERIASRELAWRQSSASRFDAESNVRHLASGCRFTLAEHFGFAGSAFTVLGVSHQAANNLGPELALHLGSPELEHGSYRNRFEAIAADRPVLPCVAPKPVAPGMQCAVVVGAADCVAGFGLSTERDGRVRVQFPWQRGVAPLAGGLAHDERSAEPGGNAPGDAGSGTWVRLAQPSAGANWGTVLLPRVGSEVVVGFVGGDIDQPVVVNQLHSDVDLPPYSAGLDSGVNHPGVLSGLHANSLTGADALSWVLDDATGQSRMRLLSSAGGSELGLGHLIQQAGSGANRGAWRGSGFEARSAAWVTLRAAEGLLVSASTRAQQGTSVASSQMDAAEATAQIKAAQGLGGTLGDAARQQLASGLPVHLKEEKQAFEQVLASMDPKRDGKYAGSFNGQRALKADPGSRTLTDPVERLHRALVVLEAPSTIGWATPSSVLGFAGQDQAWVAQGDLQLTAARTLAAVSGEALSVFTHSGGVQVIAANAPVGIRAHTNGLALQANEAVTIVSVDGEITVSAQSTVEMIAGQGRISLDGADITFACPGSFTVKAGSHGWHGAQSDAAELMVLPSDLAQFKNWIEISHRDTEGSPMVGQAYKVFFEGGQVVSGKLDGQGFARHENVPARAIRTEYEPREPKKDSPWDELDAMVAAAGSKLN
jgi:type VI secretion system secreted protein VgrG